MDPFYVCKFAKIFANLNKHYQTGNATEHTYCGDLPRLIESLIPGIIATNEPNLVKRDTPVMMVMGNPSYFVSSTNKGEWIENLVADYKKDLNERNIQPLSDDYIKLIRYGQHFIEKTGEGILAYISNNGFIDGIIYCKMREN